MKQHKQLKPECSNDSEQAVPRGEIRLVTNLEENLHGAKPLESRRYL